MKLVLSRVTKTERSKIEDTISLEDDSPLTQYIVPENETIDSYDLPPDRLDGFIRPVVSNNVEISFPLIEKLCQEIFSKEKKENHL